MQKNFIILYILILSLFSGCTSAPIQSDIKNETQTATITFPTEPHSETTTDALPDTISSPRKKRMTIEEMCESTLSAIQNKDTEQIKALFCNEIANTHDLDAEISDFYNSVDGNFVFFTDYHKDIRYGGEHKKGVYVKQHTGFRIRTARTDTNKKYKIEAYANLVYDEDPDKIGLEYIVLTNEDGEEVWIGEVLDN